MITYKFTKKNGEIEGKAKILSRISTRLSQLMNGEYILTVKKVCKTRSLLQNRLYWKWVDIIASETGNSKEDVHEVLKQKFLTPDIKEILGERITVDYTTKNMSTQQFVEYMQQIEAWALSELGITLPLPDEDEDDY